MRDKEFLRDKVPMTKEEIRALSICKLHLKEDSVCYDIGSGAGFCRGGNRKKKWADPGFCDRKKASCTGTDPENIEKFALPNIQVIAGEAPDCLKTEERSEHPTHAFIGGSSGRLKEILDVLYKKIMK